MSRLTKKQHEIIGMFELGEIGDVEFTELALEAGMPLVAIETILRRAAAEAAE